MMTSWWAGGRICPVMLTGRDLACLSFIPYVCPLCRCKLFYKKDGSFVEKGVGMLYLKPCSDEKFQCLIRADTNLGNILLNIKLSK